MTLIELLVVMALICLVAAIAIPSYHGFTERARRTEATTALLRLRERQERWFLDHNAYAADLEALGFAGGCSENCVYTLDFPSPPDSTGFTVRATPTPGGGRNGVDQAGDRDCQWFTLDSLGVRDAGPGAGCW